MEDEIDLNAHSFLKACYLNQELPVGTRMKAAAIAIGYERPRLAAAVNLHLDGNTGDRLDRANARVAGLKAARLLGREAVIEYIRGPKVIEGEVLKEEAKAPVPMRKL